MAAKDKVCLNPSCKATFTPGHYGARQLVCSGSYKEKCRRCRGKDCPRCHGKLVYEQSCQDWYRGYWAQTRRPPRGIPEEDYKKILLQAAKDDTRKRSLIIVARRTGMRKGEILGLTWADVTEPNGSVKKAVEIRGQWDDSRAFVPTKTHASRLVYLEDEARVEIAAVRKSAPKETATDRVFPYWESGAYTWFIRMQKRAKIVNPATGKAFRFHDLRHSLGHELVRAGQLNLAKKMLGHRKLDTTLAYAEQDVDEVLADLKKARRT